MASFTVSGAKHATLTAGTVDTVTLTGGWGRVEVLNRTGTADIYFTTDGSTPSGGCDNCQIVPSGSSLNVPTSDAGGTEVVNLVGNGNGYSVVGTNEQ